MVTFVLNHADAVTSVADHLTERIDSMGVRAREILTFPMSVPVESFCMDGAVREEWKGESVILSNRSLYPVYNVEVLVRAAPRILKQIPDARIVIAGEGPEHQKLASLAEELGVAERVRLVGTIPHDEMPDYLRAASVYVSTALSDGASVSLLEAMACGTFPVVADIPANREWIEDGTNGFLFPSGDDEALAKKIVESLEQQELKAHAREVNVQRVQQRAQWNLNVEKLTALYNQVLARK
jgi:glycosyltransferase involved in cell wall biosynthesis